MVLQADEAFLVLATGVEEVGPILELAVAYHLFPGIGPEVIFNNVLTVLRVDNCALVDKHSSGVPFAGRLRVLGNGRNKVVEGGGLTVAILAQAGIGVTLVV